MTVKYFSFAQPCCLTGKGMSFCPEKFKTAQNIHKRALFCLFNPLFSQTICLIHQIPALMLDLISGPYPTLASDPHDLECSCMLQTHLRKGSCEIPLHLHHTYCPNFNRLKIVDRMWCVQSARV